MALLDLSQRPLTRNSKDIKGSGFTGVRMWNMEWTAHDYGWKLLYTLTDGCKDNCVPTSEQLLQVQSRSWSSRLWISRFDASKHVAPVPAPQPLHEAPQQPCRAKRPFPTWNHGMWHGAEQTQELRGEPINDKRLITPWKNLCKCMCTMCVCIQLRRQSDRSIGR